MIENDTIKPHPLGLGNVGRVGNNGVEHALHSVQPVAVLKAHGQAQPLCVGLGHHQGVGAGIHRQHLCRGPLALQCQRNGATAGAQIGHTRGGQGGDSFQRPVHQRFGVGAGVQHAGIHLQRQAIELLAPGEVGHGLTRHAALAQGDDLRVRGLVHRIGVVRQQPGTAGVGAPQCMQQQQLRVDAGQAQRVGLGQSLGEVGCVHGCSDIDS